MKISIIGGGNMGSAIAFGLASSSNDVAKEITIINRRQSRADEIIKAGFNINSIANDSSSLQDADIVIIAVKPWLVEDVLTTHQKKLNSKQFIISVAASVTLEQLEKWTPLGTPIFRVMPNTAISIKESMTFISSYSADENQNNIVLNLFSQLGKAELVDEALFPALTSLTSCGIAFAFRYIRAAMEGGVEMGIKPTDAKKYVIQTLRGAANLLEENNSHPEEEIDKVTTPGGITIKGLNEMEHAGFTSAIIKGLKASNIK